MSRCDTLLLRSALAIRLMVGMKCGRKMCLISAIILCVGTPMEKMVGSIAFLLFIASVAFVFLRVIGLANSCADGNQDEAAHDLPDLNLNELTQRPVVPDLNDMPGSTSSILFPESVVS